MRITILLTLAMAGCLSEGTRPIFDATSEMDGTEPTDGTNDSALETDGTVDTGDVVGDLCANVRCDDNDPCTFDRCNPGTGLCEFLGTPGAPNECASNSECEDQDACTVNTCIFGDCGGSFCLSETISGCSSCEDGCDDRNPCTRDVCRDGTTCYHVVQEGCLPGCVAGQAYSVPEVVSGQAQGGGQLKVTGLLKFDLVGRTCDGQPSCACVGTPALVDDGMQLALRPNSSSPPGEWTCESRGCEELPSETCRPAFSGVRYRAWGRGLFAWELANAGVPSDAAVPAASYAGIVPNNFCLETQGDALVGSYSGLIAIGGVEITFDALIKAVSTNALQLSYRNASCPSCQQDITLREGEVPLTAGDGWVEFDASLPSLAGDRDVHVRLYSNRNVLTGAYGQLDNGLTPFVAPPPGGRMTLERRP